MSGITVNGLDVKIVRKKIKNMYLRIGKNGEITVSAPLFLTDAEIERFVVSKSDWLKGAMQRTLERQEKVAVFDEGERRTFLGKEYTLHIDTSRKSGYYFKGNDIVICVGENSTVESRKKALANVYREALNEILPELTEKCQSKCGLYAKEWRVRDMKTRWGSCNTKEKRIWISVWLIEKPIVCIESVIYHELAHLKVRGHGMAFYDLLLDICPYYKEADRMLKRKL